MLSKKTNDKEYLCQEENNDGPSVLRFMLDATRESSGMLESGTSAQEKLKVLRECAVAVLSRQT